MPSMICPVKIKVHHKPRGMSWTHGLGLVYPHSFHFPPVCHSSMCSHKSPVDRVGGPNLQKTVYLLLFQSPWQDNCTRHHQINKKNSRRWCAPAEDRQVEWNIKPWRRVAKGNWQCQRRQAGEVPSLSKGMSHWKCVNNRQNQVVWAARPPSPVVDPSHPDSVHIFQALSHLQFGGWTKKMGVKIERWKVSEINILTSFCGDCRSVLIDCSYS